MAGMAHWDLRVGILGYGTGGRVFHAPLVHATPGLSVAKGLTLVVKFPLASALDAPATLLGWSQ